MYDIVKSKSYKVVGKNGVSKEKVKEVADSLKKVKQESTEDILKNVDTGDSNIVIRDYNPIYESLDKEDCLASESKADRNEIIVK